MALPVNIQGYSLAEQDELQLDLVRERGHSGAVVFTDNLFEWDHLTQPAVNDTYGNQMAVAFAFGGSPVEVHDGLDTTLWTGSAISGSKWDFNKTSPAQEGADSVEFDKGTVGDTAQFAKGSSQALTPATFTHLTLWVYPSANWSTDSVGIFGWDTGTGLMVGNSVPLEDYFDQVEFGVWSQCVIPLADMGLGTATIDAIRVRLDSKQGQAPTFYMDQIQFEETGTAGAEFVIAPPDGKIFEVDVLSMTMVDALDISVTNGTAPGLAYNQFLGVSQLSAGILIQIHQDNVVTAQQLLTNLEETVSAGGVLSNVMCDGTNTSMTVTTQWRSPVVLNSRTNDRITVTLNDDLGGLLSFKSFGLGRAREPNMTHRLTT